MSRNKDPLQKNPFVLPSISFSRALNIYSAYTMLSPVHAGVLTTTSLVDSAMMSNYGFSKNYFSLSAFWGYVGYKSIEQVIETMHC